MLLLKFQIFGFWSKFILFTQLSRQQIQFSKIWLCHILVNKAKNYKKKKKKIHWVDSE